MKILVIIATVGFLAVTAHLAVMRGDANAEQIRLNVLRLYACGYRDGAGIPAPAGEECPETRRKAQAEGLVPNG